MCLNIDMSYPHRYWIYGRYQCSERLDNLEFYYFIFQKFILHTHTYTHPTYRSVPHTPLPPPHTPTPHIIHTYSIFIPPYLKFHGALQKDLWIKSYATNLHYRKIKQNIWHQQSYTIGKNVWFQNLGFNFVKQVWNSILLYEEGTI